MRSWLRRLNDFVFGYDFFVAHAWHADGEGHEYAERLASALEPNLRCFLDSKDFQKGADWTLESKRALSKTSVLIVVATPPVFASQPVLNEVTSFVEKEPQDRIIVIDVGNTFSNPPSSDHPLITTIGETRLRIPENSALAAGPSKKTLDDLRADFTLTTENTKRQRILGWTVAALAALSMGAGVASWVAFDQERLAKQNAIKAHSRELAADSLRLTQVEPARSPEALRNAIRSLDLDPSLSAINAARSALSLWPRSLLSVQPAQHHGVLSGGSSSDGARYALCERDNFRLLDAKTGGTVFLRSLHGYDAWSDVKFSADSRWVAVTRFRDGKVDVFDAKTGGIIRELDHQSPWKLSWHPCAPALLASGSAEIGLFEFDSAGAITRKRTLASTEFNEGTDSAEIMDAAFSDDGSSLAVTCVMKERGKDSRVTGRGVVHCLNWPDLSKIASVSFTSKPTAVAISGSTKRVAVIDATEVVTVWDFARNYVLWSSGSLAVNLSTPTTAAIRSTLAFSDDGKILISGSLSPGLRAWDSGTGRETVRIPSRSHIYGIQLLAADRLRFTNADGALWESSISAGDADTVITSRLPATARDFFALKEGFCFPLDNDVGILNDDRTVSILAIKKAGIGQRFSFDSKSRTLAVQTSPASVVIGGSIGSQKQLPVDFGKVLPENERVLTLSPGATHLAVAGEIGLFQVYDTDSRQMIWELPERQTDAPRFESLLWDISGRAVAAGTTQLVVYDLDSGASTNLTVPEQLRLIAASDKFTSLICDGPDFLGVFRLASDGVLHEERRVPLEPGNRKVVVSPKGRFVCIFSSQVTGTGGSVFELQSLRKVGRFSPGTNVVDATFSDDETQLAFVSESGQCGVHSTTDGSLLDRWRTGIHGKWIAWTSASEAAVASETGTLEIRSLDAMALRAECTKRLQMFESSLGEK